MEMTMPSNAHDHDPAPEAHAYADSRTPAARNAFETLATMVFVVLAATALLGIGRNDSQVLAASETGEYAGADAIVPWTQTTPESIGEIGLGTAERPHREAGKPEPEGNVVDMTY
jgi:hypothetical protein